jgi:hypothetical protein
VTDPLACRLDAGGLRRQRDRYRALGRHATAVERRPRRLAAHFGAGVSEPEHDPALDAIAESLGVGGG